ncbi:MAG: TnpV protein [Oscillospiraceae bacterium]|nr:TnpV protein [Oscillospiraceae bacterium]
MELAIHNEKNGLDYTLCGDFYLPNLLSPQTAEKEIGIWGMRHLRYIKQNKKVRYINLLTTGELNAYLAEIDERAQNMKAVLIKQMFEHEGVNEMLKEQNQLEWVQKMNNIRNRAEENIYNEVIYK